MDFPIVLEDHLFPVQAFFNAMSDRDLISTLDGFSKGIGAGFNDAVCEFSNEIEAWEKPYIGTKFYIFDEELIISKATLIAILRKICQLYLVRHPEDEARLAQLVDEIAKAADA